MRPPLARTPRLRRALTSREQERVDLLRLDLDRAIETGRPERASKVADCILNLVFVQEA